MSDDPSTSTVRPQDEIENGSSVSRFWGKLPADWKVVPGSSVYTVNPNPKPETELCTYIKMDALDEELPWPKYFGERRAADYSGKTFRAGDTLMARITPCTENGKAALVPKLPTEVGIGSTEYAVLSPDTDRINPWYLYYLTKAHPVHDYAIARMRGSTGRQRVPFSVFRRELDVPLPPLEEQRKIASILYIIEQLIENTDNIIERHQRLLTGVRQDLMQFGLYDAEPYETNTIWGSIPASWTVVRIADVVNVAGGATPSTDKPEFWGGEIAWATPTDITNLETPQISKTDRQITEQAKERVSVTILPPNSVLLTSRASIGKCAINTVPMATNQGFQSLIPGDKLDTWYLYYCVQSLSPYLNSLGAGSTFKEINKSQVKKVKIPLPPLDEQRKIGNILKEIQQGIVKNRRYRRQLKRLKKGLQQDLLTGQVRTHNKDIEILDEVLQYE